MGVVKQRGVRPNGGKCRIRYRGQGPNIDETLEIPYTPSGVIEAARELKKRRQSALISGSSSAIPDLQAWAQDWLDTAGLRPSSRVSAKRHLNKIWLPELGAPPLDQIDVRDVRRALATTKHLATKTRENYLATLRSCLQTAVDEGVIDTNPAAGIRPGNRGEDSKRKPPPDPFTLDERDAIIAEMAKEGPGRLAYWAIGFFAGTRPGETLALTWSDYDRQEKQLTIRKQIQAGKVLNYTKTTAEDAPGRTTCVVEPLRRILANLPRDLRTSAIVVSSDGRPFNDSGELRKSFNRVLTRLNIRYRSPYNARHTRATDVLERGIDPSIAADELGHSLQMFLTVYAKWVNQDRKKKAFELMEARL